MSYVTFGEVQEIIKLHFNRYKTGLSFDEAARKLYNAHLFREDTPAIPDFLSWNTTDFDVFHNLCGQIPVYDDIVFTTLPEFSEDRTRFTLEAYAKLQINLDSIYAPEVLMELDYITIVYVLDGNCILLTQDGKRSLKKGELVILAPGFPYRILCSEEDLIINILSTQKLFEDHFFEMIHQNELLCSFFQNVLFHSDKDYLIFDLPVTLEVCEIIKHLFMEYLSHDTCADAVFQNYLQIFYAAIIRNSIHSYKPGITFTSSQKGHSMSALPLLQYIHANYKTVTLEELSELFHYAPAYISRLIRKSTNKTFSELKTDMKTAEAKELLLHTNLSIEAISERVGYNSADHFTYSFRKKYEMSPREYRRIHNSNE